MKTMLITLFWWIVCLYVLVRLFTDRSHSGKSPEDKMSLLQVRIQGSNKGHTT